MKAPFKNRSMVITGASSGLGEALALEAAAQGARLVIAARRMDRLEALAKRLEGRAEVHPLELDLSRTDSSEKLIADSERLLGGIDVLILNAGQTGHHSIVDSSLEEARALMDVNFFGPLASIKAAVPGMLERKKGHIAVISSYCAYAHLPWSGPYSASKAAVASLARVLSIEVGPPIWVTVVYPGVIRTEMFDKVQSAVPLMARFEKTGMDSLEAAQRTLEAIDKKRLSLYLTRPAVMMDSLMRIAPDLTDRATAEIFRRIPAHLLKSSSEK